MFHDLKVSRILALVNNFFVDVSLVLWILQNLYGCIQLIDYKLFAFHVFMKSGDLTFDYDHCFGVYVSLLKEYRNAVVI